MAVRDLYVLSETDKGQVNGANVIAISGNFETIGTDSMASKYRLDKVGADFVPIMIHYNGDAIAGATDMDLGLYDTEENGGAVKDADCFMDGTDLNAGHAMGSEIDCLTALGVDEASKTVRDHAGDSNASPEKMYDLVLTTNGAITGAGTMAFRMIFRRSA